jgi:hypothetical protein
MATHLIDITEVHASALHLILAILRFFIIFQVSPAESNKRKSLSFSLDASYLDILSQLFQNIK